MLFLCLFISLGAPYSKAKEVQCPKTPKEWQNWMDQLPRKGIGRPWIFDSSFLLEKSRDVLDSCPIRFRSVFECTKNLRSLLKAQGALGFTLEEKKKVIQRYSKNEARIADPPPEVLTPAFWKRIIGTTDFSEAKKYIDDLNSRRANNRKISVSFAEGFTFQALENKDRMILMFPGKVTKLVLIGSSPKKKYLIMATIAVKSQSEKTLVYYGNDHYVELKSSEQPFNGMKIRSQANQSSCTSCHLSGPISILRNNNLESDWESFNEYVESLSGDVETPGLPPNHLNAPSLGPMSEKQKKRRDLNFLRTCSKDPKLTINSAKKIAQAMNCAKCHNNSANGRASVIPYISSTNDLIKEFILSGNMPKHTGKKLNQKERQALFDCLIFEYFKPYKDQEGVEHLSFFNDWIFGRSCKDPLFKWINPKWLESIVEPPNPACSLPERNLLPE